MARPRSANPRSVLVALRVTPRVRYGLKLLAQRERCSLSELVLRTIEARFDDPVAGLRLVAKGERKPTSVLDRVWSPHECERVVRLGLSYPDLLDEEQTCLWRTICETSKYWQFGSRRKRAGPQDVQWKALAADWPRLKRRAGVA